jgi:replication initiation and membrane attachment protein DnaB
MKIEKLFTLSQFMDDVCTFIILYCLIKVIMKLILNYVKKLKKRNKNFPRISRSHKRTIETKKH